VLIYDSIVQNCNHYVGGQKQNTAERKELNMTHILHIDSSSRAEGSTSRELSAKIATKLGGKTTHRDLLEQPLQQLSPEWLGANWTPAENLTSEQTETLAVSTKLIQEIKEADTLVIGVAMYNFGIPASLKAWVDLVCRAGHTFEYTEKGPNGLMARKRAIVVIASGGVPFGSPARASPGVPYSLSAHKDHREDRGADECAVVTAADDRCFGPQGSALGAEREGKLLLSREPPDPH
jgi:FMN-dependent NADH-azoreductase